MKCRKVPFCITDIMNLDAKQGLTFEEKELYYLATIRRVEIADVT